MNTELSYGETGLQENVSSSNPWDTLKDVKMRREMPAVLVFAPILVQVIGVIMAKSF